MANENLTIFQRLNNVFRGTGRNHVPDEIVQTPLFQGDAADRVLFSTSDKDEYERKLKGLKQQKYLSYAWQKAGMDNAMESTASYSAVKLMYRDADLMDATPEIGTALDIVAEESCPVSSDGKIISVHSNSPRIKAMLEDLFVNRLHIYTDLSMIARHTAKYGNTFMLLNIDKDNGVMGWRMLPVYEMDRLEPGYGTTYSVSTSINKNPKDIVPDEVKFVRTGVNEAAPYRNWQVAHFRLLNDSIFLPYGCGLLHKARRAWRMWSMMEDAMLMWRLDKAVERRVFKVYVGGIDDEDVQGFIQEIQNRFKRTPMIDPQTGQIDLKKSFLDVSSDYFIPVRDLNAPNPIETLQAANSQVQMEDIQYMQSKMLCAMRIPKSFLNFNEAQGKGQNLALLDIRFARMINKLQQFLLMELNKIAMIHLYIMGMTDEIGNFTLSLNSSSNQLEAQELDALGKRLQIMQTALTDPGIGMPMMSLHKALKDILKMSDSEIKDMLNEIYLEKAMAAEVGNSANLIKDSNVFTVTKRMYGDYDALQAMENGAAPAGGEGDSQSPMGGGGGGGAMGGFGDFGGDDGMDMGEPGADTEGELGGAMGETDMGGAPAADEGAPLQESKKKPKKTVTEANVKSLKKKAAKSFTEQYFDMLMKEQKEADGEAEEVMDFEGKSVTTEATIKSIFDTIDGIVDKNKLLNEETDRMEAKAAENLDLGV